MEFPSEQWGKIADNYRAERGASFASALIDPWVDGVVGRLRRPLRILDVGAGTGHLTELLAEQGHKVTAIEPCEPMRRGLLESPSVARGDARAFASVDELPAEEVFDVVLCINVLDHVDDMSAFLRKVASRLLGSGTALVSIPHPMKDLGDWVKSQRNGQWQYEYYRVDGYLAEGVCEKNREDQFGNVIVHALRSHHRTLATYFAALRDAGLRIL